MLQNRQCPGNEMRLSTPDSRLGPVEAGSVSDWPEALAGAEIAAGLAGLAAAAAAGAAAPAPAAAEGDAALA